jgi:hypothetical protein
VDRSLAIKVLEITEYPPSGHGYETRATPDPSWEEVESAIRDLNHFCLPFIFIGLADECCGTDCLSVLGGPKGYSIMVADENGDWLQYCDPSHTGGDMPIWTSDQGFHPKERYVTYDLDLALRIARYYAESGQRDPSVQWER